MADYALLAVLATGNPGTPNTSNFGIIPKLKVSDTLDVTNNITVGGTVDGVDVATLNTNFGTHDGGTAAAQHSSVGAHDHETAGNGGKIDHGLGVDGLTDDDHTQYSLAAGTRAFSGEVAGVTPTVDASLATKGYVDSVAAGLDVLDSCRARAQSNVNLSAPGASIDGVTMAVDDRFLADQQSTGTQDGVYDFQGAATPATRSADVPTGKEMRGVFLFIEEGTNDADIGYVCTNDKGSDVIGTDALTFTPFSTPGTYTGGDGIDITTLTISVDLGTDPGLEFVSNALEVKANTAAGLEKTSSGVGINLEASNSSMQVSGTELGIKFDASGGLQKGASGTGVKIDDTPDTLDVDSSGIKVVGLPSLFKVNGSAVGATVTATNLDELTDGSSSVTIHTHDVVAHAIGSASHTASTQANINSKISDLTATFGAWRDIGAGTDAQRPSAAVSGRLWWSTDSDTLSYDNGATWDEIVAVASAHDFEGSSHNACTLAEFNAADRISDKDLIASDDSRLSDDRDPNAHDFEGADHNACTLAEFNAANTISDKDLIASDDSRLTDDRDPNAHDFEGADHTACTLAEFNTANTISDADLISDGDSRLTDDRDPNAHASDHKHGGGDEVAQTASAANAIPKGDGSGKLAVAWISEVLAFSDLSDDPYADHSARHENSGADEISLAGLDGEPSTLTTHKAIEAENAVLGHVIVETASLIDVDGAGKLTLGAHASTHENSGSDEISVSGLSGTLADDQPAAAHNLGGSKHGTDTLANLNTKITGKTVVAKEDDNTWSGKQEFDDEITVSTLLMDGAVIGPQISATIGTGGVTAGDTIKFDGSGQIIRRSADSDDANGICTVGGAASAAGWYLPFGIAEVTWESAKAPTAYGEAVFLSQSPGNYAYWSTDVPSSAGKIYEGWAYETGTSAKIYFSPRKSRVIEA